MIVQVAPLTPPPLVSHRSQRYRKLSGGVPDHVPFVVTSVWPCTVVPDTTGSPVLLGAAREPAEPPAGIRSAASSAPTRIARVAMPFPLTRRCRQVRRVECDEVSAGRNSLQNRRRTITNGRRPACRAAGSSPARALRRCGDECNRG